MSAIDKIISAVTPPESEEKRKEARAKARAMSTPGDWLGMILDHHERIDQAFEAVKAASDVAARRAAEKELATLLNGHLMAEEITVYPAIVHVGEKGQAEMGYTEQVAAKMQMAALSHIDPMSQDYMEKLGHLEGAVKHHVYEEESKRFLELKDKAPADEQERMAYRYREEFERYMGGPTEASGARVAGEPRSFGAELSP